MTAAQLSTLAADIKARPALFDAKTATKVLSDGDIAGFYNTLAAPVVGVWKPVVTLDDMADAIDWTAIASLQMNQALAFQTMIWQNKVNMANPKVRAGFDKICGAASATSTGIKGDGIGQRPGTNLEVLFGVPSGGALSSALFGVLLTAQDVTDAIPG